MDQHYVPQFLLQPWADHSADGKLEVFRLDLAHIPSSRRRPRGTAFEPNLYSLTRTQVAGMEQHAIERGLLRNVDSFAAGVRRKLIQKGGLASLTREDRVDWTTFLMSLRVRTPEIISHLRVEAAEELRRQLAAAPEQFEDLRGEGAEPTLEAWAEQRFPGFVENFGLSMFKDVLLNATVGNKILRMKWWVWDFEGRGHQLLLADRPCIFTAGIEDPNLVIALPISPTKAFMTTQSDRMATAMRATQAAELAIRLNEQSYLQARTRIYSRSPAPRQFLLNRQRNRAATSSV